MGLALREFFNSKRKKKKSKSTFIGPGHVPSVGSKFDLQSFSTALLFFFLILPKFLALSLQDNPKFAVDGKRWSEGLGRGVIAGATIGAAGDSAQPV